MGSTITKQAANDFLPLQFTKVKKFITDYAKEQVSKITDRKVKNLSSGGCVIDFGDIELMLSFYPNYDKSAVLDDEPQMMLEVNPSIIIRIFPLVYRDVSCLTVDSLFEQPSKPIVTYSELSMYLNEAVDKLKFFIFHFKVKTTAF